jgi:hypothetical protein
MRPSPMRSPVFVALAVVAALGICALFAAVTVPVMLGRVGAWPVAAAGSVALLGALGALAVIQGRGPTRR